MAAKKQSSKVISPNRQAQQEEKKRWQLAEAACRTLADTLFQWSRDAGDHAPEAARQYCAMMAVHYRKLRNGRVLSPGDFDICVEVSRHALRTLQSLDASLEFADWPRGEALRQALQSAQWVLAALQKLKSDAARRC
jgi:hypothetical protein